MAPTRSAPSAAAHPESGPREIPSAARISARAAARRGPSDAGSRAGIRTGSRVRALTARMIGFRYTNRTFAYQSPSKVDEVGASSAGVLRRRRSSFRVHLRTTIGPEISGPGQRSCRAHEKFGAEHRVRTATFALARATLLSPSPWFSQRAHPPASCLASSLLACPMPSPECLQDCGGIGGSRAEPCRQPLPRKLLHPRANRRIGVRRRPVS